MIKYASCPLLLRHINMEVQNPFQIQWDKGSYQSFADFFFLKIAIHGSNLAMVDVDTGKQWRYSELKHWSDMCTTRLKELQVTATSRVAVITGTSAHAIFVQLACCQIGCAAVVVNGWNTVDEIWQLVDLSEATHLIVEHQFLQKADDVRRKAAMRGGGRIKHVRIIDEVLTTETIQNDRKKKSPLTKEPSSMSITVPTVDCESDLKSPVSDTNSFPKDEKTITASADYEGSQASESAMPETMLIFFTSGTTGLPKAAEVSHQSLVVNIQQISLPLYGPVQAKEKFLLPVAISHIFGSISVYYALVNGAVVYMLSRVTPKTFIEGLVANQINVTHITPQMLLWLALDPVSDGVRTPHLRSMIIGGAPLDSNLANAVKQRLAIKDMRQVYGMTELGGICTMAASESSVIESVGAPLPGMLFKIVNWDTKQLCAPRKPGHLLVSGPQVMPSYYKNPKATAEIIDTNGFVRTGDAAFYDELGRIYVLDKIKDIIKCKGTLICPSEVELILRTHPGVDDCAVVGRQDHVAGEVPAAFVVKNAYTPLLSSAEVRQFVSGKIATFKELRGGVFFISEIPRSVCGKVLRRHLRQFWDRERTNSKADLSSRELKNSKAAEVKTPTKRLNGTSTNSTRTISRK